MSTLDLSNQDASSLLTTLRDSDPKSVTAITLNNNELSELPPEIFSFARLKNLTIQKNKLSALSPKIGDLKNLLSLDLSGNQLNSLPSEIGNLQKLERLDLSANQLSSLPAKTGQLKNLISPGLYYNPPNSFPSEIGNLQKLERLDLSGNQLSYLPAEIGQLKNLISLYLHANQLSSLPSEIGNLQKLERLNLSANQLSSLPSEIGNLQKLERLDLSGNQLSYLPAETGRLKSLSELLLYRNQLNSLPPEIGNLANLKELYVFDNNIDIENLPREISNLAKLNNLDLTGKDLLKPELPTNRIYIFRNFSLESLKSEYGEKLDSGLSQRGIECKNIETKEDLDDELTIAFIIIGFDISEKSDLINHIIQSCREKKRRFYILLHSRSHATGDMMNLAKMADVIKLHEKLEKEFGKHIAYYESLGNLIGLIVKGIRQHSPVIRVNSLKLTNIGHFQELSLAIDDKFACFEGENGTGKTIILQSIALGLTGHGHNKINKSRIKSLLSIKGPDSESNIEPENGKIELGYAIDGKRLSNIMELKTVDESRDIEIVESGDFQVLSGKYNLKSLIVGFPQARGEMDIQNAAETPLKSFKEAHVDDLIPLINNADDQRLESFAAWIVNLNNAADQEKIEHPDQRPKEESIIEETFEIITRITGHKLKFKMVRQAVPPEIWVETRAAPQGIPMNLLSQGFKVILSWVGYLIQRMAQAYPFSKRFTEESAIVLIDEIDGSLHPKWQSRLFKVLKESFPNTQFITSSHSPLNLGSLKGKNVYLLDFDEQNRVNCHQPPFNPYGADVNRILSVLMGQKERAIEEVNELLKEYSDLADDGELDKAREIGRKLKRIIDPEDPDILKTEVIIQTRESLEE